jgi:hypothetical protein
MKRLWNKLQARWRDNYYDHSLQMRWVNMIRDMENYDWVIKNQEKPRD